MNKEKKHWFCPKCKKYPDYILQIETVETDRRWDGECYQGRDFEYTGQVLESYCSECDTKLINKE